MCTYIAIYSKLNVNTVPLTVKCVREHKSEQGKFTWSCMYYEFA